MAKEIEELQSVPAANEAGQGSEALQEAAALNADRKRRKQYLTAGVAVGVGSAAVVAALLYSSRKPRRD